MPYITNSSREVLDTELKSLVEKLKTLSPEERAGNLNYTFTYLINELYSVNKYRELNDAVGMLECCKQELYRRRVGPYENLAIDKNGDMPNYPKLERSRKGGNSQNDRELNGTSLLNTAIRKIKNLLGWE